MVLIAITAPIEIRQKQLAVHLLTIIEGLQIIVKVIVQQPLIEVLPATFLDQVQLYQIHTLQVQLAEVHLVQEHIDVIKNS